MTLPAAPLNAAIAGRLLAAVTPAAIELALKALTNLEERDKATSTQWRLRIERARYEADLAERRYEAVDPANRLIAATLERRWNDALQRVQELKAELASFECKTLRTVTPGQKQQILQLAGDFPRLWCAPTTTARDRKRMLRVLIKDITAAKGPEPKQLRLQVRCQGGAAETVELRLPQNRAEAVRYPPDFAGRIRDLAKDYDDGEIAASLCREGLKSTTGKPFTASMISWISYKHRIPGPSNPSGTLSVAEVRQRYGVTHWTVYEWIGKGLVQAHRKKPGMPYAITITGEADRALRERLRPPPSSGV